MAVRLFCSVPGGIRTPDRRLRRLLKNFYTFILINKTLLNRLSQKFLYYLHQEHLFIFILFYILLGKLWAKNGFIMIISNYQLHIALLQG